MMSSQPPNPKDVSMMGSVTSSAFHYSSPFDDGSPWSESEAPPYWLVSMEETATDYVYKMDAPRLQEEVRLEIRWGRTLRVIGAGDALVAKVRLPRNHKVRVSWATASVNRNRVITVRVPKREPPRKWYQDTGLRFRTIFVAISENY